MALTRNNEWQLPPISSICQKGLTKIGPQPNPITNPHLLFFCHCGIKSDVVLKRYTDNGPFNYLSIFSGLYIWVDVQWCVSYSLIIIVICIRFGINKFISHLCWYLLRSCNYPSKFLSKNLFGTTRRDVTLESCDCFSTEVYWRTHCGTQAEILYLISKLIWEKWNIAKGVNWLLRFHVLDRWYCTNCISFSTLLYDGCHKKYVSCINELKDEFVTLFNNEF